MVSDANAVRSLITHGYARDRQDAAYKAFTAGLDMDMASGTYLKYLRRRKSKQVVLRSSRSMTRFCPILETKIRPGTLRTSVRRTRAAWSWVLSAPESPANSPAGRVNAPSSCCSNEKNLLPLDKARKELIDRRDRSAGRYSDQDLLECLWGAIVRRAGPLSNILARHPRTKWAAGRVDELRRTARTSARDIPVVLRGHLRVNPPKQQHRAEVPRRLRKAMDEAVAVAKRNDLADPRYSAKLTS